jgi:large repetitive protein
VDLYEGGSIVDSVTAGGSGDWSVPLSGVAQGEHTYTARARDAAGNTSGLSDPIKVTVDGSAPVVESTLPVPSARGVARKANIAAMFSDAMDPTSLDASARLYQWNALRKNW